LAEENQQANRILDALGNQTRREILALLREGALPVGAIASHLPISRPAVSKHLRILQEAGLVGYDPNGRRNIFYLKPAGFRDARVYLELFWDEALASFKRVAEETAETEL
jgi:DNA-binding transcriptional ArsR family regulator